jgi:hypothetical protein
MFFPHIAPYAAFMVDELAHQRPPQGIMRYIDCAAGIQD